MIDKQVHGFLGEAGLDVTREALDGQFFTAGGGVKNLKS